MNSEFDLNVNLPLLVDVDFDGASTKINKIKWAVSLQTKILLVNVCACVTMEYKYCASWYKEAFVTQFLS